MVEYPEITPEVRRWLTARQDWLNDRAKHTVFTYDGPFMESRDSRTGKLLKLTYYKPSPNIAKKS